MSWDAEAAVLAGGTGPGPGAAEPELPMPVRWLYVLADGSLGVLDEAGNFTGDGTPGESNPIVGRVAFWADDETCKVNVNTAA